MNLTKTAQKLQQPPKTHTDQQNGKLQKSDLDLFAISENHGPLIQDKDKIESILKQKVSRYLFPNLNRMYSHSNITSDQLNYIGSKNVVFYTRTLQYHKTPEVSIDYVEHLQNFLTSDNFSNLCCEFYILQITLKVNQLKELIPTFVRAVTKAFHDTLPNHIEKKHDTELNKMLELAFFCYKDDDHIMAFLSQLMLNPILEMIVSRQLKNSDVIKRFITNLQKYHRFTDIISKGFSDALKDQINAAQKILDIDAQAIKISHAINNFKDRKNYGYNDICAIIVAIALYTSEVPRWLIILASILYLAGTNKYFNQLTPQQQEEINTLFNYAEKLLNNYDIFYTLDIISFFSNQDIDSSNVDANIFHYLKNYVSMPQVKVRVIEITSEVDKDKLTHEDTSSENDSHIETKKPYITHTPERQTENTATYSDYPLHTIHGKEKTKTKGTPQRGFAIALTNKTLPKTQVDPKTLIITAGSITSNCPSRDVLYKDLIKVTGKNGSTYYAFWDHKNINNDRYKVNIKRLKQVFYARKETKGPEGSNGFNRLRAPKYKAGVIQTYEVKDAGISSRVYGLFHNTDYGLILVCYDYDNNGHETGHK